MIRIGRSPDAELVPDLRGRLPGRGGWVCPTRECLQGLCARPRQLGRALRQENIRWPSRDVLRSRLSGALDEEILALVPRCAAAGLVRSGARGIQEAEGPVLALLCASDASALSVSAAREVWPDAQAVTLSLDRSTLGGLVHRGPRAVLAVRAGTPGDQLALRLRWRQALG